MPVAEETCEIVLNGATFKYWTSVRVETHWATQSLRIATVTLAEPGDSSSAEFSAATKIRASDPCKVYLAGNLVINGFVAEKQVTTGPSQHGVQITVMSRAVDAARSSVAIQPSQYIRKDFATIAKEKLAPHGVQLVLKNPPPGFDKVFRDFNVIPGEGVLDCIDRLARMRGMVLHDDEDGNLVAAPAEPENSGGSGDLVEGRNIKMMNSRTSDQSVFSAIQALGQERGDDNRSGKTSAEPAAEATNSGGGGRSARLDIIAPHAGDSTDMKGIARSEMSIRAGQFFDAIVTVYGWQKSGGDLWKIGEYYSVTAPMHLIENAQLWASDVVYGQDDENGTITTLSLTSRPQGALNPLGNFNAPTESGGG